MEITDLMKFEAITEEFIEIPEPLSQKKPKNRKLKSSL